MGVLGNCKATESRKSGLGIVGDIPWGTHFCHFFETKEDLLNTLVPYFKAGLESKEYCLWLISEPLTVEEASGELRQAVPDIDQRLAEGSIELVPRAEWFLEKGLFDLDGVMNGLREKLGQALARGYPGMRASGNPGWLRRRNRKDFFEYERALEEFTASQPVLFSCGFSLSASKAADVFEMAHTHRLAAAMRNGAWEVLETPDLKQSKAELQTLRRELETRVMERAKELKATNNNLRKEVAERKRTEKALKEAQERVESVLASVADIHILFDRQWRYTYVNEATVRATGLPREKLLGRALWDVYPEICGTELDRQYRRAMDERMAVDFDFHYPHNDTWWENRFFPLQEGLAVFATDITRRKKAEAQSVKYLEQLRALAAHIQSSHERERARVAREVHDELGQALTIMKIELSEIQEKLITSAADEKTMKPKVDGMLGLIDTTIDAVRRIAAALRPSVLDDLGLVAAIQWKLSDFEKRTGIKSTYKGAPNRVVNKDHSIALFRILQESLTNVARHSRAKGVEVTLRKVKGNLVLKVRDNGRGIQENEARGSSSLGIVGMQERALLFGGDVEVVGRQGKGTTVTVRIPIG